MTVIQPDAIEHLDKTGMLSDIVAQPLQLEDALWRAESAGLPGAETPGGLLVCGMGGSAIGADLANAVLDDRATRPLQVLRGYSPPGWLTSDYFVLCSSYSGETEETLACYEAARVAGAPRAVLTTGGSLAAAAREDGVPVIGVPSGMQPRAAVIYMAVGVMAAAAACNAAPSLRGEVEQAEPLLRGLADEWGPGADGSLAAEIAHRLHGTIPVVHGAGPTLAPAMRWKTQINENAETAAFASALPEANHNEICGWERGRALAPLSAVFLENADQHPRVRRRVEVTAKLARDAGAACTLVDAKGDTPFERVLSLVLLGDLVSVYLAVLEGIDPTPVEPIERFKAELDA
ncbi:MAG TPA: bifunctional phosphoglucose/phosphomannose isomerase [Thermoleophilaceae bacterium]|nr:bifunctional phosphoglucose/phosphomannose isomerase [Thermoleophilaceae bacterium]